MTFLLTVPQVTSVSTLNNVIFKNYASAPIISKFTSLFPGLGYAAGYKVRDFSGHKLVEQEFKIASTDKSVARFYKECTNMEDNHLFAIS